MGTTDDLTMFCMTATPFDKDGSLDEGGLRGHLRRLVAAGNGVYLGSGGSGEGHALSVAELRRVYEIGVEECKGRVPTYANPRESRNAAGMYEVAKEAVAAGVDCVQLYGLDGGHGMKPTPREQEAYYHDLLDAIDSPVAISVHAYAGYLTPIALLRELCRDYPRVCAINVMGQRQSYFLELRAALPRSVKLYAGMADLVQALLLGAEGCLAAEPNIIPNICRSVLEHYKAGDIAKLSAAITTITRFSSIVNQWAPSSARWVKMALKVLDLPGGRGGLRKPYLMPGEDEQRRMGQAFAALGIRELEGLADQPAV